ncbi:inorganic diphosphatase [Candidatus Saccharibacteria bacterium]|nr:inorganic diphosphatase [Candidatus Saccharibacteria bacterium]
MADFNQVFDAGDYQGGTINVVIEIPTGSSHKIEWDRQLGVMKLDRVEPRIFAKPTNYGFIPQTLDEDGDELDVLLITDEPLTTGLVVEAKIIGVMKFVDDNEVDDKIVAVPADDRNTGNSINSIDDLPEQLIKQIEHHFSHYKDLKKPGSTVVKGFEGIEEAKQAVADAIVRWQNQ